MNIDLPSFLLGVSFGLLLTVFIYFVVGDDDDSGGPDLDPA